MRCRPCWLVPRPHQQQAGELTRRARRRLQRGGVPCPVTAHRMSPRSASSSSQPCVSAGGAAGWTSASPGSRRGVVAELGVVLHRAAAQRVGAEVDRVLPVGEPGEVGDEVALGHLGDRRRLVGRGARPGRARRPPTPAGRWCGTTHARRPGDATARRSSAPRRAPSTGALVALPPGGHACSSVVTAHGSPSRTPPRSASISSRVRRSVTATSRPSRRTPRPAATPARNPCSAMRSTTTSARHGGAHRELAQHRRVRQRLDAVEREQRLARVARAPGAAQRQLAQPGRAQPRQLDGAADGDQRLVGADVGRRLLPADVLLPRAQRRDVGPAALGVDGLAHQAAGQAPHVLEPAGEQAEVGPAEAERRAEGLPLPHHHVGAVRRRATAATRRRPGRTRRAAARRARGQRRPRRRGPRGSRGSWGTARASPRARARRQSGQAVRSRRRAAAASTRSWPVPAANVRSDLAPVRVHALGSPTRVWPTRCGHGQVDRLDARAWRRRRATRWRPRRRVRRQSSVWYSNSACSTPWATSGWYGV